MRKNHTRRPTGPLVALLSVLTLVFGGFLVASPAQADETVGAGTNVTAASNACGEVTFTGANSDSTITVTIGGEFGKSFDVGYEESVTITTAVNPLAYVAVTQWGGGEDWIEESSIEVELCEVDDPEVDEPEVEQPDVEKPEVQKPEVQKPTVAPDAGR